MTHYATFYTIGHTARTFFHVYERLTGRIVHDSAIYDTQAEAEAAAAQVVSELDAAAARDEQAYLKSFEEGPES